MPQFSNVANVGDQVLMGLEGDPAFPFKGQRPTAVVTKVSNKGGDDVNLTLKLSTGEEKIVNPYTIDPKSVWEFSDDTFTKVMERERAVQAKAMAAEKARAEPAVYRGTPNDMHAQISQLRKELAEERQLTRNFHNTYIASLHELANDVQSLDTTGKACQFCRTFNSEYKKMQSRGEMSLYRGTGNDDDDSMSDEDVNDFESDYF